MCSEMLQLACGEEPVACELRVPLMSDKERRGCKTEELEAIALALGRPEALF